MRHEREASESVKHSQLCSSLDPAKPLLFHVGKLGKGYWEWVNQPEPTKPRFFASDLAEACSKTVWWIVPLLWLPIFSSVLIYSSLICGVGARALVAWVLTGIVAWQALGTHGMHWACFKLCTQCPRVRELLSRLRVYINEQH